TAAAAMLKGTTAQYLIRRTYAVKKGDIVLFHAAAGGVGLIACQWLKALGAKVIGTVGSDEKAKLAKSNGCWQTINYRKEDFSKRVNEFTKGAGVPVIYDSVGKDTFSKSMECLAPLGMMVLFGQSSGPVPPFNVGTLARGSHFVTRPGLGHYIGTRADYEATCRDLFKAIRSGAVKMRINQRYDLKDAAKAHLALESRQTTGASLLIP
ncbi:MAG: quinone oxidoreductase, partial [Proteobacteria bacterium]|nr:quinone oxidoreductase [Pseudomonadota bacterium]